MGNSENAYYLAPEFPQFMQEEFPKLRFSPKPRRHPKAWFTDETSETAHGNLVDYHHIYDQRPSVQGKFTEGVGFILPQAARFRVFAYVYATHQATHPDKVFEVTTDLADIEWRVNLANKKSRITRPIAEDPAPNMRQAPWVLDTATDALTCRRILPRISLPNLGYAFLEPDDDDRSKVNGRLHVIGNEGDIVGDFEDDPVHALWNDNWFDSAADGSVEATIRPKGDGASLRERIGVTSEADLEFLGYQFDPPRQPAPTGIPATPGWVVVGCPDYVPDMGHLVSLWDLTFDRGIHNLSLALGRGHPAFQEGKHKLILFKREVDPYLRMDYLVHLHPQICLFQDVRYVSGQAQGDDNHVSFRGHNNYPSETPPVIPPEEKPDSVLKKKVEHGQMLLYARDMKDDLADPAKLKDKDPRKPINEWLKVAIYQRLRKPGNLYTERHFVVDRNGTGDKWGLGFFPRKLGRRLDFDKPVGPDSDKGVYYVMPHYQAPEGDLRRYHGDTHLTPSKACGRVMTLSIAPTEAESVKRLAYLDDMYWPATFSDMPMLRELAFTYVQYDQFGMWQAAESVSYTGEMKDHTLRTANVLDQVVSPGLRTSFAGAGDPDKHFSDYLATRPNFAPAMIDMAHLGSMIGGSFLPGIEVGREAGIARNWTLFHGGTSYFPDVRFKPCDIGAEHTIGTLTKDLAVPWTEDYKDCDETYWPTARPGDVYRTVGEREYWMNFPQTDPNDPEDGDIIPHLERRSSGAEYLQEYWKSLKFIRRRGDDHYVEDE
jgi:hypothetical protein